MTGRHLPRLHAALLWTGFVAVHGLLTVAGLWWIEPNVFGDVDLYRFWAVGALEADRWPVLDEPWVYPPGALLPVLLPALLGAEQTFAYTLIWCGAVTALNAAATAAITRRTTVGAWWWLAFLLALGPLTIGRLDGVLAPLMVLALVAAVHRPALAAALLAVGAWIKIVPGAVLLAVLASARRPVRQVLVPVAAVSGIVIGAVLLLGWLRGTDGTHLLSSLGTQDGRGLQAESVVATPWALAAVVRPDVAVVYEPGLFTYEIRGPGATVTAAVLDVAVVLAVLGIGLLLLLLRRRGGAGAVLAALPVATLTMAAALIVTNKVGSPQFASWLAPAVAVALSWQATRRPVGSVPGPVLLGWRGTAAVLLALAGLTQLIFPHRYLDLVAGDPLMAVVLALRNGLTVLVLCCALGGLVRLLNASRTGPRPPAR